MHEPSQALGRMRFNPDAAVYGTITIGALLAAETAQRETYLETVGAVLIASLLYWLAHSYAESAGWRLRAGEPLTLGGLLRAMGYEVPILFGAALPLLALLLAWALGARLTTGVSAAIWVCATVILLIELAAALRADKSGAQLILQAMLGALLGLLVIALKIVLH